MTIFRLAVDYAATGLVWVLVWDNSRPGHVETDCEMKEVHISDSSEVSDLFLLVCRFALDGSHSLTRLRA